MSGLFFIDHHMYWFQWLLTMDLFKDVSKSNSEIFLWHNDIPWSLKLLEGLLLLILLTNEKLSFQHVHRIYYFMNIFCWTNGWFLIHIHLRSTILKIHKSWCFLVKNYPNKIRCNFSSSVRSGPLHELILKSFKKYFFSCHI